MNDLLQRHGCSNVFTIPEGLKELMADISREVLRDQPSKIFDYIENYLSVLLITREHGILSVKILDDLCDCRPSLSEHLMQFGMTQGESEVLANIIKEEIEGFEPEEGKEKVRETQILKKILARVSLDETMAAQTCQVARNAYRDYWYRKKLMEKNLKVHPHEAWEVAAERTLELYKKTKPSYSELNRATKQIQAAYRGYHVRRNLLRHLKSKKTKSSKVALPGPPIDVAGSREIDLGPVINVRVKDEDTTAEFNKEVSKSLHLGYNPMRTITHVGMPGDDETQSKSFQLGSQSAGAVPTESVTGPAMSVKSVTGPATSVKSVTGPAMSVKSVTGPATSVKSVTESSKSVKSVTGPEKAEMRIASFKGIDQPDPLDEPPYKLPHVEESSKSYIPKPEISDTNIPRAAVQATSQGSFDQIQLNKISFADKHHELIINDEVEVVAPDKFEDAEVPEEIPVVQPPQEDAQEVPEDIPDDRTEGDSVPEADDSAPEADDSAAEGADSVPLASEPSSAPATDAEGAATEDEAE